MGLFERAKGGLLDADAIRDGLNTKRVGRLVRVLPETTSTNDEVLARADDRAADGLAVLAEQQTSGRGRMGRQWVSPRGASVLCSVLVFLDDTPAWMSRTTLIGGVAAYDAARPWAPDAITIKWPNDLLVSARKLGGVLVESRPVGGATRAFAIGVGINCLQQDAHWPAELRGRATSLEIESDRPVDRVVVVRALLTALDTWLCDPAAWDDEQLKAAWVARASILGQRIRLRCDGREYAGSAIDIDPSAGLLVELDRGRRQYFDPARTTLL